MVGTDSKATSKTDIADTLGEFHSYLLQSREHPQCVGCDAPFTVRHFLLECGDFAQEIIASMLIT